MTKNKIISLISTAKIEQACKLLIEITNQYENTENYTNTLIVLMSRYHELRLNDIKGIISVDEKSLENNRIIDGLISSTDIIFNYIENGAKKILLEKEGDSEVLVYDSADFINYAGVMFFDKYNTARKLDNISIAIKNGEIEWNLIAEAKESVGINFFLNFLKGRVEYEYYTKTFNKVKDNIMFYMIPMKSNYDLIEVGSEIREDESNGFSPFRVRKISSQNSGKWLKGQIDFDFTELDEANESVFAPRINEGSPRPDKGEFRIRKIKIYKT